MFKELESDIEGFVRPKHGYLGGWAEQGVLLLNACLTVRKAEANSHKDKGKGTNHSRLRRVEEKPCMIS